MKFNIKESLNPTDRAEQEKISKLLLHSERSPKWVSNNSRKTIKNIAKVLLENGYTIIGQGQYRSVYSKPNINFVIKVARHSEGVETNSREIAASLSSTKSIEVKNILPNLYEFDRRYDPVWLICEKVVPVKIASLREIVKVFPTFYRILKNSSVKRKKSRISHAIIELVIDVYSTIVDFNLTDIFKIIQEALSLAENKKDSAQDIIDSEALLDINHFIRSISYDYTKDLHSRNLGIRKSGSLKPEDFVILDFDTQFQRLKSSNQNMSQGSFIDFFSDERNDSDFSNKNESIRKNIYSKLLKEFHNKEQDIASKLKEAEANPKSWSLYNDLYDVLKKEGYDIIGSGISRVVFSKKDVPFVIKLASYPASGFAANSSEIKFSTKEDSSNQVSSILPELYSYSENKNPWWIMCEKVIPVEESSIENLVKAFPTLYYFAKQKTLNDGSIVERDLQANEFLSLIKNVFYNITTKTNVNIRTALSIIKRACKIMYSEDYDLHSIINSIPLLDIKRFIMATSYDYTMDVHLGNLGIRNEKDINSNSFVILDFDPKIGGSKKQIRHTFDSNPDHPSHLKHDAEIIRNINDPKPPKEPDWSAIMSSEVNRKNESFTAEVIYERLIMEASKQKRSKNRSHPGDSYEYGWPEFDDAWFDAEGIITWKEDREWTKQWYKRMGLMK